MAKASGKRKPEAGDRVRDTATGRVGIFQGVYDWQPMNVPKWDQPPPKPMAFIRPEGGGAEWMTPPYEVEFAD
ncbi:hypothetical protein [Streptomyces lunaelactis]|uniref:hypothetical protein n=1 Tax=Streptomyces lunaelactis TaxID=1535768 RepID=UPI001585BEFA|nr:hypothetical protein [Streptomyces lunaelactis]NUK86726.1 hypothetical protein [Streptomyces lunaelactis]